ncbi:disrupted in schizophrenia 1 protein isoform X2 [Balaenoptera acutorostrata]|uniref:Disrupted in schizophrenia 1 protein isoform X2 n=1 Tax=Balaenoptera acutorostrata TaxID=9767 RepID=A0ABM3S9S5_BALAC|nr:disrupted in schizophrenia 1 protein isoform X2 [Balaenoptera acutorostrata]
MLGGGPQGAPAGGGGGHRAGSEDCLPPAASFRRRRLARRPGYMRSAAGPRIGFLSPPVGALFRAQGGARGEESHHAESRAGPCGLDPGGQWRGPSVGSPVHRSTAASALASVGHRGLTLVTVRGSPGRFGTQPRADTTLPKRLPRPCGPGDAGRPGELPSMDSHEAPSPHREAAWTKGRLSPEEVRGTSGGVGSGPEAPSTPAGSQDVFASSFSFIRLSLGSAGERGEAEGCPPSREAEAPRQSPEETEAKAASSDGPRGHPRTLSSPFALKAPQGLADAAQTSGGGPRLECETLPLLDTDATSSCAPDPSWFEGGSLGDAHRWDPLLGRCKLALSHCLQGQQRRLEVKSLSLKLQKLQEKAVEEDDYDKAEMIQQRLEALEKERSSLHFQLPSQQPALSGLLGHLRAQAQATLHRAAQRAGSDDTQAQLRMEPKMLEPTAQDNLLVSITRRDWLLQEKQQLQKEIEALQARMSVLDAKDQQLRREIEEQEWVLPWQGCDLVGGLSLGELQELSKTLQDTLALAEQIPVRAEPPETIRSLQERIKPLNLSLKEITAKVCMNERLCSALRKKVNDIETQLPALLEAKVLAISGNHFCTAKELTEEIRSLTSEREGLEGLLHRLLVLSSRNVQKLGSVKEDYSSLRRELDQGKTAYETSVKANTMKYMEMLEDKLHSCKCPLLGKVWEADLEACRLLIQSLQLQEARDSLLAEDERQTDDLGGGACTTALAIPPRPHSEDERKTPLQAFEEWKVHLTPSPHCAGSEQKEESYVLSAELGEKCEAIGKKLLYLEDQLHTAIHSHDEDLIQSLKRELQMVKETLQAMILQLQPAKEAGEREAAASCGTAGVREAPA